MKHYIARMAPLLWIACTVLQAQTPILVTAGTAPSAPDASTQLWISPGTLPPMPGQNPVAFWTSYLGLDAGQQASIKAILSDQQSSSAVLRRNLEQARNALEVAKRANSVEPEIDRLSQSVGAIFGQITGVEAKTYMKFYAVLTPDQKQKFDKMSSPPVGAAFRQ